jgi:hypothetical protein
MSESALVRKIKAAVKLRCPRAYVLKVADRFTRFVPDLIIQFPREGRYDHDSRTGWCDNDQAAGVLWVETKVKDGVLSKGQRAEHDKIRAAGGSVMVARTVEDVINALIAEGACS